ncbi:Ankyrin-3 [Talaromyces islandicus]|uniref:Ankyrin-3 n=1 Tax=Talaromyces islandicus TaxID=28573 RepID=A0A0U1LTY8_TALIS|nr:Ankyrin-3 [Talaromyces islandicus]
MSNPDEYTVGWICAVSTEYVAARAFLDEEHERPQFVSRHDNNDYTLGKISGHYVVLAVLPDGEYGIASAASVARDMLFSFPNVRIGLMVGIGGGAPSPKHDIRLGDIVVSIPRDGKSGVFQYDYGKAVQDQAFRPTGYLNQPPTFLRTAVNGLKAKYESDGHQLDTAINSALEKKPRLRKKYSRPDPSTDRLYRSEVTHPLNDDSSCSAVCSQVPSQFVERNKRPEDEDNPAIHYGVIASGSQLMKDASVRDKLAAGAGVLCFEMEAAGLMNQFPCLVVRGICDYSDSHKNKEWQGYAAMAAAAYTKDLLRRITPNKVEAETKICEIAEISDIVSGLYEVAGEQRSFTKQLLQVEKDFAQERLSNEEQRCHQLFRLTVRNKDATYEWYKDRVEERVGETCMWFLNHENFQRWLKQESGPLLVSADPGCGKSVLTKYLIDDYLPRWATICYFFFKDNDQNTVRQAICAVLHQLFSQKPSLIKHAMAQYRQDGQGLVDSMKSLWKVLQNAIKDPQAGPVIIVLDALDECDESEFLDLMRNVESQFRDDLLGQGKLKYLLTSRPYEQILSGFDGLFEAFPYIRIPGEEESETISQEVNRVISHRVDKLAKKKTLAPDIKVYLETRLRETTHRTYLWVYLVFDYLEKLSFKKTLEGVKYATAAMPKSVNDAYEQILKKSEKDSMVRKALSIILAASRPLTLSEMNIAVSVDDTSQSIHDLDLEDEENFKLRIRSWCGLFVSIHHQQIYFLHQTAREFLLADAASPANAPSQPLWYHSITIHHAHAVLAKLCVLYLNLFNFDIDLSTDANGGNNHFASRYAFLDYSAKAWGAHFRKAGIVDDGGIVSSVRRICDPSSKSYSTWFSIYRKTTFWGHMDMWLVTELLVASYFGHSAIVKLLLGRETEIEAIDNSYGRTALSWAAFEGHDDVVKILLEKCAEVNSKDEEGCSPLALAAMEGHEAIGAEVNSRDDYGRTPLSLAVRDGREDIIDVLLEKGAEVDVKDKYGRTPLLWAAEGGRDNLVATLVRKGTDLNIQDTSGLTALQLASFKFHAGVEKVLLQNGASIPSDFYGLATLFSTDPSS